jgi:hypothetical protein
MMPVLPPELIEWASKAGAVAAPIFLFLWWDERSQRMAKEAKIEALAESTIKTMTEFKGLLDRVVDIFNNSHKA